MKSEKLIFPNAGGQSLAARLDWPDEKPISHALFAHCFTCSKNLKAVGNISKALVSLGIAVFRFDFTGLGESEGDFAETNFSSNVEDLVAAAGFLEGRGMQPEILVGHSLGGAAVLQAAHEIPSSSAVVTIGAPSEPSHVKKHLESSRQQIEEEGEARVRLAGRTFRIQKQFLDDLEANRMKETIAKLRKALLILHSPLDQTVGIENAADIFGAAKHPKSFVSLDEADHLLTREEDSRFVGSLIGVWARRYLSGR